MSLLEKISQFRNKNQQPVSIDELPGSQMIKKELGRVKYNELFKKKLMSTISTLIVVAAVAVLIATLWLPTLQIYGESMTPTLNDGNIVVALKTSNMKTGDIVAFYYNNKILVKRVIAGPGDWVDINADGVVSVNGQPLDEPYVTELAYGETNIKLPMQVPDGRWFVMGDHRSVSIDSRNTAVGTISQDMIIGRLLIDLWPFKIIQ